MFNKAKKIVKQWIGNVFICACAGKIKKLKFARTFYGMYKYIQISYK